MPRITMNDLEAALGGASALRDLLDKNDDGVADQALVDEIIELAEGEARSAVQVAAQLDDPAVGESRILHQRKLTIAKYWAYHIGTSGQAVPEHVREAYQDALRWLDDVATGRRTLGTTPAPAPSFPVETVDIDPQRKRTTRSNLKGFC